MGQVIVGDGIASFRDGAGEGAGIDYFGRSVSVAGDTALVGADSVEPQRQR